MHEARSHPRMPIIHDIAMYLFAALEILAFGVAIRSLTPGSKYYEPLEEA